jgi:DhnA family fructose-bisphosphate aldolase class Ia
MGILLDGMAQVSMNLTNFRKTPIHRVVEMAGQVPVLVRGGGRASDMTILSRTEELIRQGASGIVYGRNVIQHENPLGITRALLAIVHENASSRQASQFLQ